MLAVLLGFSISLTIGADISDLQLYEDAKAIFQDSAGKTVDPLAFMKEKGLEYARIRIFVNPKEGGPTGQSTAYVTKLAKKCKDSGLQFLLDFHYSDSWADPGQQVKPAAWKSLSTDALIQKVYDYTKETLQTLVKGGATPDSIQIGNEITPGFLFEDCRIDHSKTNFLNALKNGIKAAREVCPKAKIVIHTDRGGDSTTALWFYGLITDLDYDVIGLSYYPIWHGSLNDMKSCISSLGKFNKEIWIAEVAYSYASAGGSVSTWPATPAGQKQFLTDFIAALKTTKATSFFWWFPEETYSPTKKVSDDLHRGLWSNKDGKALPAFDVLKNGK